MKKDKSLTANDKSTDFSIIKSPVTGSEIPLIDENLLKKRIHTIRGVKVMLDADLAEIYGYTTKAFNQQVKNNIEKFAEDFRFQLNSKEVDECSRSKILTLNGGHRGSNVKYAPYALQSRAFICL